MKTLINKCPFNGWKAETIIPLQETPEGLRVLEISTLKRHGGKIGSHATVFIVNGNSKTTIIFQDYSKTVASVAGRATEKTVLLAHESALAGIQAHIEAAKAQYGIAP